MRATHDLGPLDIEGTGDADGSAAVVIRRTGGSEAIAVNRATSRAANADGLIAKSIARLLG